MNEKILRFAIEHLTSEEERLKQISIALDVTASDAKAEAEKADQKWRECRTALRALLDFATESEVRF